MSTATKTRPSGKGAAGSKADRGDDGQEPAAGGKKKKLLLLVGLVLVVGGAAAWFFLLRGGPAEEPEPVAGEVLALEPISVNLAAGKYLRVGIALQLTDAPAHAPDGSHALDLTISTLSGMDAATLADPVQREAVKADLGAKIGEAYHHDVMDIYFTEFVTQ